jgi:hypothetical protein
MTLPLSVPAQSPQNLYLVELRRPDHPAGDDGHQKLSPALGVTKDAGGTLKGSDNTGQPVIALSQEAVDELRKSRLVRTIYSASEDFHPVTQLKLSYDAANPPTEGELRELGLKLVEDYRQGSFMVVEPASNVIDSKLLVKMESMSKFLRVTPLFHIRSALRGQ